MKWIEGRLNISWERLARKQVRHLDELSQPGDKFGLFLVGDGLEPVVLRVGEVEQGVVLERQLAVLVALKRKKMHWAL